MERLPEKSLRRERLDDNTVVWRDSHEEAVKIQVDDETGITFTVRKGVIPGLTGKLQELEKMYPFKRIEIPDGDIGEGKEIYKMEPGYNWNCRKWDFVTIVGSWLEFKQIN